MAVAQLLGRHSLATTSLLPLLRRSRLVLLAPALPSLRPAASPRSGASSRLLRFSSPRTTRRSAVPNSSGGEIGGVGGQGGGRGGRGGGGGGGGDGGEDGSGEGGRHEKTGGGMTLSQKITLGYAALVGLGGVMGYLKSGSQKSLGAGGASALLLCFVYTQLPTRPAFASAIGLGLSAVLVAVMGSRFRNSRKIFPAGVVSLVSLVMVGGYAHGIMRGLH